MKRYAYILLFFSIALTSNVFGQNHNTKDRVPISVEELAKSLHQSLIKNCTLEPAQGLLSFDPPTIQSRAYYSTRAVRHVPGHVQPKDCFVWRDGSGSTPWRPIPGTGYAHWVTHQKGSTEPPHC